MTDTFFVRVKRVYSRTIDALCFALKHGFAGAAVIVGIILAFILPMWTKVVYLDGRYMTPALGFWTYLVNDLPAMLGILVIYIVFRCYWIDRVKGAPKEH